MPSETATKRRRLRRREFRELCEIQYALENRGEMPTIPDSQLGGLHITRDAPFDIDEEDPIDLHPRFFLPRPVDEMEEALRRKDADKWSILPPVDYNELRSSEWRDHIEYCTDRMRDARQHRVFCDNAADIHSTWAPHPHIVRKSVPRCYRWWFTPQGPRGHQFESDNFLMWPRSPNEWNYNPDVPHAFGTIRDSHYPADGYLLRSELLLAICLLKAQIRQPSWYIEHQIYPVLVVCYHSRFSARIVQAYFQNGALVVRPSRLVSLHTPTVSSDVKLLIRWLKSRPVGNTRWPSSKKSLGEDEDEGEGVAAGSPKQPNPLAQPVAVGG